MVSRWALAACLVQLLLAAMIGEVFPVSRYSMYADLSPRERLAVPIVLVDGELGDVTDFVDFSGLDLDAWRPPEPCSLGYVLDDVRRWVSSHRGAGGPHEIALGFIILSLHDGTVSQERVVQQTGHARAAP